MQSHHVHSRGHQIAQMKTEKKTEKNIFKYFHCVLSSLFQHLHQNSIISKYMYTFKIYTNDIFIRHNQAKLMGLVRIHVCWCPLLFPTHILNDLHKIN